MEVSAGWNLGSTGRFSNLPPTRGSTSATDGGKSSLVHPKDKLCSVAKIQRRACPRNL